MAPTCPTCGDELPPGAQTCPRDGALPRPETIALTSSAIIAMTPAPPPLPSDAAADGDLLLGRLLDGRYRIRKRLGAGGVGAVYEGDHVEIKRRVALKVLHASLDQMDDFRKRFEREAQAAGRLSHPSCVSVLDFGRIGRVEPTDGSESLLGKPYLVMEFVSGELLLDRMAPGRLPPREAVSIARGVLTALRHAHGLGLVHRDVKPANVMLASAGDGAPLVKLLDFGLAKGMGADSPDAKRPLTQAGMVFGTPGYLSPEQATGKPADARSDLYSLSVVLFEMACGRRLFERDASLDLVHDHVFTPPTPPRSLAPSLSPELEAAILKGLAKDPQKRFQTAEEFDAALAACREGSPIAEPPSPLPRKAPSPPSVSDGVFDLLRRHPRAVLAAGGALTAIVAAGLIFAIVHRPPPAPPAIPVAGTPIAATPFAGPLSASARRHLSLAEDYQRKLWCSDAIDELERALHEEPQLRANPEVTRYAIPCLRAKTQAKAIRFLVENVGAGAKVELESALAGELSPDVREGAQRALSQVGGFP